MFPLRVSYKKIKKLTKNHGVPTTIHTSNGKVRVTATSSFARKTRAASSPYSTLPPTYLCQVIFKDKYKSDFQPNQCFNSTRTLSLNLQGVHRFLSIIEGDCVGRTWNARASWGRLESQITWLLPETHMESLSNCWMSPVSHSRSIELQEYLIYSKYHNLHQLIQVILLDHGFFKACILREAYFWNSQFLMCVF